MANASILERIRNRRVVDASMTKAVRDAVLTHARLGRSVPQMENGQIEWLDPEHIFARYGLDEFGREILSSATSSPPAPSPE